MQSLHSALCFPRCVLLYSGSHCACHREGSCDHEHASGFPVQQTELELTEHKGDVLVGFTEKCRGGLQVKFNQQSHSAPLSSLRPPLVCQTYFMLPSLGVRMAAEAPRNTSIYNFVQSKSERISQKPSRYISLSLTHS